MRKERAAQGKGLEGDVLPRLPEGEGRGVLFRCDFFCFLLLNHLREGVSGKRQRGHSIVVEGRKIERVCEREKKIDEESNGEVTCSRVISMRYAMGTVRRECAVCRFEVCGRE